MENSLKEFGVNCPECQQSIQLPLDQVLFGNELECHICQSKFSLSHTNADFILKQLQASNFSF